MSGRLAIEYMLLLLEFLINFDRIYIQIVMGRLGFFQLMAKKESHDKANY